MPINKTQQKAFLKSPSKNAVGRPRSRDKTVKLLALLGGLSETNDVLALDVVQRRLGTDEDTARQYIDSIRLLAQEEEYPLPLYEAEGDEDIALIDGARTKGVRLRLSDAETTALAEALAAIGVDISSPFAQNLFLGCASQTYLAEHSEFFSSIPVSSAEISPSFSPSAENPLPATSYAALPLEALEGAALTDKNTANEDRSVYAETLAFCVRALLNRERLLISYQGANDKQAHARLIDPLSLVMTQGSLCLEARDVNKDAVRSFRIDRIESYEVEGTAPLTKIKRVDSEMLALTFYDQKYLTAFDWPGLEYVDAVGAESGAVHALLPRLNDEWLVRRIIACGGTLVVDDAVLMAKSQSYAQKLLNESKAK